MWLGRSRPMAHETRLSPKYLLGSRLHRPCLSPFLDLFLLEGSGSLDIAGEVPTSRGGCCASVARCSRLGGSLPQVVTNGDVMMLE